MMATFKTLEGLLEAVSALPSTIKYLKVQRNLNSFQAPSDYLDMNKDLAVQTKKIIDKALSDERFNDYEVLYYRLNSHCGDHCPDTDSYYIMIETKASKRLGKQLFNGELGSLD
jgi:hypothetical protein